MHTWLRATRTTAADGSGLARAIDYSLKRRPALARYANSGDLPNRVQVPIDNNPMAPGHPVENAIRPIAIGKKKLVVRRFAQNVNRQFTIVAQRGI